MTVSLIEIRIWTVYPGQFPGQPDARDSATFRLNDPDGQLSKKINRLEHLERCKK